MRAAVGTPRFTEIFNGLRVKRLSGSACRCGAYHSRRRVLRLAPQRWVAGTERSCVHLTWRGCFGEGEIGLLDDRHCAEQVKSTPSA